MFYCGGQGQVTEEKVFFGKKTSDALVGRMNYFKRETFKILNLHGRYP
jgi:hypothetical protein